MNNEPLPIGMLVTSIRSHDNDFMELFGFWYYKELGLPATKDERKCIFNDVLMERCCQVSLKGKSDQIEEIVSFAYTSVFHDEEDIQANQMQITELFSALRQRPGGIHIFDDVAKPKGNSLPFDTSIMVQEDRDVIIQRVRANRGTVELHLKEGWSLMGDLMNDLLNM